MDDMATGYVVEPIPGEQSRDLWGQMDPLIMLVFFLAIWGGDEIKDAMMKTVSEKAKEAIERGKQSVSESEKPAEPA